MAADFPNNDHKKFCVFGLGNLPVDEVHLPDDVDEVEYVADEVLDGVKVVHVKRLLHVFHQDLALLLALLQVQGATCYNGKIAFFPSKRALASLRLI
jgi:hypothetical protein